MFEQKLDQFRALLEKEQIERLHRSDLACQANINNARCTVTPAKKYTRVDVGDSGKYMVVNETGEIYGIKAYGRIHRGHFFGTLDTINEYYWGEYHAFKKPEATEPATPSQLYTLHCICNVDTRQWKLNNDQARRLIRQAHAGAKSDEVLAEAEALIA